MRAYLDTTILADAYLKGEERGDQVRACLAEFSSCEMPAYAIKELKAGPLRYATWLYNVLVSEGSEIGALERLHRLFFSRQRNLPMTALELYIKTKRSLLGQTPGPSHGYMGADELEARRLSSQLLISVLTAWDGRRKLVSQVTPEMSCYDEVAPFCKGHVLVVKPSHCPAEKECQLAVEMAKRQEDVAALLDGLAKMEEKPEKARRMRALRRVQQGELIRNSDCRSLGDAVFAFFAPAGSTILTTNVKDHAPLAEVLGKSARNPFVDAKPSANGI